MKLHSISFRNFRNLQGVDVVDIPQAPLLIAAAPNATGKTNFLEAIVVLLRGKSFRAENAECVTWGEDFFLVSGSVEGREGDVDISVQYHTPSKKLRIEQDSHPVSPISFYAGFPFVLFLPEDTFLLHRGPAVRRNFINNAVSTSIGYVSALVQYQRVLKQRNAALKDAASSADIENWTTLLGEHADVIWSHRQSLMDYIATQLPGVVARFLGDIGEVEVVFTRGAPDGVSLVDALVNVWAQEQRYRYTLFGPHRDDFEVLINKMPARASLSRGQVRALVIALKVVVYQFMKQTSGVTPLLLFDEVLSELDMEKQELLFDMLPVTQTLLTCTTLPETVAKKSDVYVLDLQKIIGEQKKEVSQIAQVGVESLEHENQTIAV